MKKSNTELVNEIIKAIPSRKDLGKAHWCIDGRSYGKGRKFKKTKSEAIKEAERMVATSETEDKIFGGISDGDNPGVLQLYFRTKELDFNNGFIRQQQLQDIRRFITILSNIRIGNVLLKSMETNELTAVNVNRYIAPVIQKGRSLKTVSNYWSTYTELGSFCVKNGYFLTNLFSATKPKKGGILSKEKPKLDHLNKDVMNTIFDFLPAPSEYYKRCNWKLAVMFGAQSGLRQGEQRIITWNDIEFDTKLLDVHKGIDRYGMTNKPKSSAGNRTFKLNPTLIKLLQEEYIRQGRPNKSDYIFCRLDGSPISSNTYLKKVKRACKEAGLPVIRWHDLRHYYGSVLLETYSSTPGGEWRITRNMGHSNIKVTSTIYGHVINNQVGNKKDDDTLDSAFN